MRSSIFALRCLTARTACCNFRPVRVILDPAADLFKTLPGSSQLDLSPSSSQLTGIRRFASDLQPSSSRLYSARFLLGGDGDEQLIIHERTQNNEAPSMLPPPSLPTSLFLFFLYWFSLFLSFTLTSLLSQMSPPPPPFSD